MCKNLFTCADTIYATYCIYGILKYMFKSATYNKYNNDIYIYTHIYWMIHQEQHQIIYDKSLETPQ